MVFDCGDGRTGFGPLPASMGWSLGVPAHAASKARAAIDTIVRVSFVVIVDLLAAYR
jgi:hypothetical protein